MIYLINWTKKQANPIFVESWEKSSSNSLFITLFRLIRHHQVGTKRFHGLYPPHLLFKQGQLHNMKILIQVSYLIKIFSLDPASSLTHCTRFLACFLIQQLPC